MIRSILSVIVGYLTMAVLVAISTAVVARLMLPGVRVGQPLQPTGAHMIINLSYSSLFAAAGGFVCSLIAGRYPLAHALALACLVAVLGLVFFLQSSSAGPQPLWYSLTLLLLCPAGVILGGYVRFLQTNS